MRRQTRYAPLLWLVVVVAAGLSSLVRPLPAAACGNAVLSPEARTARLSKAEKLLRTGRYGHAARLAKSLFTFLRLPPKASYRPLFFPAQRVLASAIVRSKGAISYHENRSREENLAWARDRLRAHHEMWPQDPRITASYAESLVADQPIKAHELLWQLATNEVLPHADGYAALATLAAGSHDPVTFAYALTCCHQMAGIASQDVCRTG